MKETDWSLFYRKQQKRENWERETDTDKQRRIAKEQVNALTCSYRLGGVQQTWRDRRQTTEYPSWGYVAIGAEFAGGKLGGDVRYARFLFDAALRIPAGRDGAFGVKLFSGWGDQRLPLQKRFELGGIGTLPGYCYKELGGDRAFLVHGEYLFGGERFKLVPFVGTGAAWNHDQQFDGAMVKYNAGVGVEIGEGRERVRIDFARPLGEGERKVWEKHLRFVKS